MAQGHINGATLSRLYAIQTIASTEYKVREFLENSSILCEEESLWLPMKTELCKCNGKWYERSRALLPGYIFLTTRAPWEFMRRVESYRVDLEIKLIGRTDGARDVPPYDDYMELTEIELNRLKLLCSGVSLGYKVGHKVVITSGPLKNLMGIVTGIDRHHRLAFLDLPLLNRIIKTKVSVDIIAPGQEHKKYPPYNEAV